MVDAELVQNGRAKVVGVDSVFHHVIAIVVGFARGTKFPKRTGGCKFLAIAHLPYTGVWELRSSAYRPTTCSTTLREPKCRRDPWELRSSLLAASQLFLKVWRTGRSSHPKKQVMGDDSDTSTLEVRATGILILRIALTYLSDFKEIPWAGRGLSSGKEREFAVGRQQASFRQPGFRRKGGKLGCRISKCRYSLPSFATMPRLVKAETYRATRFFATSALVRFPTFIHEW